MKTGKITFTALLLSLSFSLSLIESFIPVSAFIPVPGLKLGFANIAVMAALFLCGRFSALCIVVLRPVLNLIMFGNITSFILSLSGGILSYAVLVISVKMYGKVFSFGGISIICAVFHSIGQVAAAAFFVSDTVIFGYLPLLCAASSATGLLNGFIMNCIIERITILGGSKNAYHAK